MLRFVRSWSANSNFADNSAVNGGGGISNLGGTLTVKDSFSSATSPATVDDLATWPGLRFDRRR